MITINGCKFARDDLEFTDSLFAGGGTCVGYYKATKRQIILYDHQKQRIGGVNDRGCLYRSSRLEDGRLFHQPATPELLGGLDAQFKATLDDAHKALEENGIERKFS